MSRFIGGWLNPTKFEEEPFDEYVYLIPNDDIEFFEEEVDVVVDEEFQKENEQLQRQISKQLNTQADDIIIR